MIYQPDRYDIRWATIFSQNAGQPQPTPTHVLVYLKKKKKKHGLLSLSLIRDVQLSMDWTILWVYQYDSRTRKRNILDSLQSTEMDMLNRSVETEYIKPPQATCHYLDLQGT